MLFRMARRTRALNSSIPEEGSVRVGIFVALPALVRSLGADPAAIAAEAGFDLEVFDDPDNIISYAARGRLVRLCAVRTGCEHFGLLLGQAGRLSWLGLVGFLVQHSANLESALLAFVRYMHHHVHGAVASFVTHGDVAFLSFDVAIPHLEGRQHTSDGALAMLFNILRTLCGREWKPLEIRFSHAKPHDIGPFRRFFRAPLRFDAEQNSIAFSADWLRHPLDGNDPDLRRLLQKQIDAAEAKRKEDFPQQVKGVLQTALLTGRGGADDIAALFSMHSRTLRRRLDDFGTTFQNLVDETRYSIASRMLEDSAMEVSEIAESFGYSDASAFVRAFRRWSGGVTPTSWRAQRRAARRAPTVDAAPASQATPPPLPRSALPRSENCR